MAQRQRAAAAAAEAVIATAPNGETEQARLFQRLHENRGRIRPAPLCAVDPAHGPLLSWSDGRVFCPHLGHGGNGRFFAASGVPTV